MFTTGVGGTFINMSPPNRRWGTYYGLGADSIDVCVAFFFCTLSSKPVGRF